MFSRFLELVKQILAVTLVAGQMASGGSALFINWQHNFIRFAMDQ